MGKDSPDPPDVVGAAREQGKLNIKTAQEQARLAMGGKTSDTESLQWIEDPSSPSGYRAVQRMSPEQQALLAQGQDIRALYGDVAGTGLGRVQDAMATPFDLNAARGQEISDIQRTFLDPMWQQREEAMRNDLFNRGIREGSDAYANATRQFGQQRSDAYDKMFLDAYRTGNDAALQQYRLPFQDLQSLWGMPQGVMGASPVNTPSPGVAPTDIMGPTMQNYQNQVNAYGQQLGGLYGLGSAALGGWASAGFPGLSAATGAASAAAPAAGSWLASVLPFSDRRLKEDVKRVGTDPRGWGVYTFRYVWEDGKEAAIKVGFMADEVEKVRPDAVYKDPDTGFKSVDYNKLAST